MTPPWRQGPRIHIAESTEKAKEEHDQRVEHHTDAICIYTDGSGINGHVGAAAVCTTTQQTRSSYMGDDTTSTVYAAELQGIVLALEIAETDKQSGNERSRLLIFTDNQAAIRSSARPKGKSGSYLLKAIADKIQKLLERGLDTEICWIPAHTGIQGNEDTNRAAKEATGWRPNNETGPRAPEPADLYTLRSTLKTWTHKKANEAWHTRWTAEKRGRTSYRYTPKPTKKTLQLHDSLSKRQSALLM